MLNWPKSEMASKGTEFDGAYKHYIAAIGYMFRSDQANYIDNAIEQFNQALVMGFSKEEIETSPLWKNWNERELRSIIADQHL